jgi:hypothetical protein
MLRLMMNEHPALCVPRESWFIINLMNQLPLESPLSEQQVRLAFDIITAHWRWKDWEIENKRLWDTLVALREPFLSDVIDAVFRLPSEGSRKHRWGDKTPEYIQEIDRLHALFPKAQFIHLIRDGRDVCLSLTLYKYRNGVLSQNAKYWADYVAAGIASGRRLPKGLYLEIAYEDVVINTEQTLKKVCRFLNVPFSPKMTKFYENATNNIASWETGHHYKTFRPPAPDDVHRWRREMKTLDLITFEAVAGRTLDKAYQARRLSGVYRVIPAAYSVLKRIAPRHLPILQKVQFPFRQRVK